MSIYADHRADVWKERFEIELLVEELHGGIPTDPQVIRTWIEQKFPTQDLGTVERMVLDTMQERGVTIEEAIDATKELRSLSGFKRRDGELVIEGRQVKAMIKESANSGWPKRRWGPSNKGTRSYFAEHIHVPARYISLGRSEPDGIEQRQVSTFRGTSMRYEEFVLDCKVVFEVVHDLELDKGDWEELWTRAELIGLGASRSQGYGQFEVVRCDTM